jgi:hypothetical protein
MQSVKHKKVTETLNDDLIKLQASAEHAPGVYEVMRLYSQYQKVLEQSRAYLPDRTRGIGFASSDRTG